MSPHSSDAYIFSLPGAGWMHFISNNSIQFKLPFHLLISSKVWFDPHINPFFFWCQLKFELAVGSPLIPPFSSTSFFHARRQWVSDGRLAVAHTCSCSSLKYDRVISVVRWHGTPRGANPEIWGPLLTAGFWKTCGCWWFFQIYMFWNLPDKWKDFTWKNTE